MTDKPHKPALRVKKRPKYTETPEEVLAQPFILRTKFSILGLDIDDDTLRRLVAQRKFPPLYQLPGCERKRGCRRQDMLGYLASLHDPKYEAPNAAAE